MLLAVSLEGEWTGDAPQLVTSSPESGHLAKGGGRRGPVLVRWLCGILRALNMRLIVYALHGLWEEARDSLGLWQGV